MENTSPRLAGTLTEQNLLQAFAGECQAATRYEFFAGQARKEGLEQMAAIFMETAGNEHQHAKRFFKFLEGGPLTITGTYPAGVIGHTLENLKAAAEGETEEYTNLYPSFAKTAADEGFKDIAAAFTLIARVEQAHQARFSKLYKNLENGEVFVREESMVWKCRNCGYLHEGKKAPETCPACLHPQAYFELQVMNY